MLKYRRIIAGILAVNLLAGSILLDYTEVNANNVNTSLNMISAENSDELSHADAESVSSSEKTDAENKADILLKQYYESFPFHPSTITLLPMFQDLLLYIT